VLNHTLQAQYSGELDHVACLLFDHKVELRSVRDEPTDESLKGNLVDSRVDVINIAMKSHDV
jgi:hypothetical protein